MFNIFGTFFAWRTFRARRSIFARRSFFASWAFRSSRSFFARFASGSIRTGWPGFTCFAFRPWRSIFSRSSFRALWTRRPLLSGASFLVSNKSITFLDLSFSSKHFVPRHKTNTLTILSVLAPGSGLSGSAIVAVIAVFSVQPWSSNFTWKTFKVKFRIKSFDQLYSRRKCFKITRKTGISFRSHRPWLSG